MMYREEVYIQQATVSYLIDSCYAIRQKLTGQSYL